MVVINTTNQEMEYLLGKKWKNKLSNFSRIIGFTYEENNTQIDIELNPDRPDLFSVHSIASALNVFEERKIKYGKLNISKDILTQDKKLQRPYFAVFTVENLKEPLNGVDVTDDFLKFSDKISETVGKQRKKIAVGVHDLKKVQGTVSMKRVSGDYEFRTFDGMSGSVRELSKKHEKGIKYRSGPDLTQFIGIFDSDGVISVPPMFNSFRTRVESTTESLLVDVTATSSSSISNAVHLLAGYFLSKGMDVKLLKTPSFDPVRFKTEKFIPVTKKDIQNASGLKDIEMSGVCEILSKMGYSDWKISDGSKNKIHFKIPTHRIDVMGPMDIVEDFLKGFGIQNILPSKMLTKFIGRPNEKTVMQSKFRSLVNSMSFQETISFVLTDGNYKDQKISIENPKSLDYSKPRDSLWSGILKIIRSNNTHSYPQRVFEVGEVVNEGVQQTRLALAIIGANSSYDEMKGVLDTIVNSIPNEKIYLKKTLDSHFIKGRCAEITGKEVLKNGIIGEVSPEVLEKNTLTVPMVFMELTF